MNSRSSHIPNEHQFSHYFCFFLHDLLASLVYYVDENDIRKVEFSTIRETDDEILEKLSGKELFDWLEANGYESMVYEMALREISTALLADFCHFVYEALSCSQKAKLTVTYTLLRKPLKENLLYLEWILANPEDFIQKFHDASPDSLTSGTISAEKKLAYIESAIEGMDFMQSFSADFIYDLRYNKTVYHSLESVWHKATHLVTTYSKSYRTEPKNFNFIFSDDVSRLDQWHQIYASLPILLLYAVKVAERVFDMFTERSDLDVVITNLRTMIGLLFWFDSQEDNDQDLESIQNMLSDLNLICAECEKELEFDIQAIEDFFYGSPECRSCGAPIEVFKVPPYSSIQPKR